MINGIDSRVVGVTARLSLHGHAEFLGVHHHVSKAPTATLRVCGIEIEFNPAETELFAKAANEMVDAMRTATHRGLTAHNASSEADK